LSGKLILYLFEVIACASKFGRILLKPRNPNYEFWNQKTRTASRSKNPFQKSLESNWRFLVPVAATPLPYEVVGAAGSWRQERSIVICFNDDAQKREEMVRRRCSKPPGGVLRTYEKLRGIPPSPPSTHASRQSLVGLVGSAEIAQMDL
jgi:hypothetical protein